MNFTYLFGAGASFNAIPLVKDFSDELFVFSNFIRSFNIIDDKFSNVTRSNKKPSEVKSELLDDVIWLAKECKNHSSVDTFARKLFLLSKKKELLILKAIVSEFLFIRQLQVNVDKRYDAFFATILDKDDSNDLILPPNIQIISWNYDKQVEYSISQFSKNKSQEFINEILQLVPRKNVIKIDPNRFSMFKINGTVGGAIKDKNEYIPLNSDYGYNYTPDDEKTIHKAFRDVLYRYDNLKYRIFFEDYYKKPTNSDEYPTIYYAWENNSYFDDVRRNAFLATKETDYLIIIGYSFPTFNREIDRKLLGNMSSLRKVFIQSKEESIDGVIQRFNSLCPKKEIVPITNVEEFYIPFEF